MRVSLDNIDLEERDPVNNKPIWKAKDILDSIGSIGTMTDKLKELELNYKKDQIESSSKVRGGLERGFMDE